MLEIQAKDFVFAIQALVSIENIMEANQAADSDDKIESDVICETILGSLRLFHSSCRTLAASITEIPVNNLIKELEDRECTYKRTTTEIRKIRGRFTDELGETKLFVLPSAYAQFYFGALASFGFDIVEKFSYKAAEDVEEAGRCLAVGRSTACVFHLMRAMEEAVKVLGTRLGVQNVEKEWGKILSDLARKIETMPRGSKRDEWSSCYANLYHVKQA